MFQMLRLTISMATRTFYVLWLSIRKVQSLTLYCTNAVGTPRAYDGDLCCRLCNRSRSALHIAPEAVHFALMSAPMSALIVNTAVATLRNEVRKRAQESPALRGSAYTTGSDPRRIRIVASACLKRKHTAPLAPCQTRPDIKRYASTSLVIHRRLAP